MAIHSSAPGLAVASDEGVHLMVEIENADDAGLRLHRALRRQACPCRPRRAATSTT
ncbi:hypothetical protein I545_4739 [Mycobacterium kansasii 662]|uniref:Uncharacterized protein n=2 Tax=Mycobacterium kansasii TaxID=1768 RepID=A0A1V3WWI6_MYCKA|nr:hypothetical protein I547_2525 [Mycobacterium kansasii 824]EUA13445.1 hypothetical protein I545_4739 [Mycobacterium kansasii 662]KEP44819.1 hypothetical protein MKSMC1_00600 [Mycobacterium kansasii]OOK71277.1 hypothetical protein BZL29_5690 [Mycobacterium kansasii]